MFITGSSTAICSRPFAAHASTVTTLSCMQRRQECSNTVMIFPPLTKKAVATEFFISFPVKSHNSCNYNHYTAYLLFFQQTVIRKYDLPWNFVALHKNGGIITILLSMEEITFHGCFLPSKSDVLFQQGSKRRSSFHRFLFRSHSFVTSVTRYSCFFITKSTAFLILKSTDFRSCFTLFFINDRLHEKTKFALHRTCQ